MSISLKHKLGWGVGSLGVAILFNTQDSTDENLCFVVMPDHVHWLFQLSKGHELSCVVSRTKGRSSFRINRMQRRAGPMWQAGFHDHAVRQEEDIENLAHYTIVNPVRAGLVGLAEDYPHWWSQWHPRVRG